MNIWNVKREAWNLLDLLFSQATGSVAGSDMSNPSQKYSFFKSKNNRNPDDPSSSSRFAMPTSFAPNPRTNQRHQSILGTPRLSNPELDGEPCPKCKFLTKNFRCSNCRQRTSSQSPVTVIRHVTETAAASKRGADVIDVSPQMSEDDDEEPIPITTERKDRPIPPPLSKLDVKSMFVGTIPVCADVFIEGPKGKIPATFHLKNLRLTPLLSKRTLEQLLIHIPANQCLVWCYAGPLYSHLDRVLYIFVKMTKKDAVEDLMKKLDVTDERPELKMDPAHPDKRFQFVSIQCHYDQKAEKVLQQFPNHVLRSMTRDMADELFNDVKAVFQLITKSPSQSLPEDVREARKKKYHETMATQRANTRVLTPNRSTNSLTRRACANPEVISLDLDDEDELSSPRETRLVSEYETRSKRLW